MIRLYVIEEGKSNKPVNTYTVDSAEEIEAMVRTMSATPNRYRVEVVIQFIWNDRCAENWERIFKASKLLMSKETIEKKQERERSLFNFIVGLSSMESYQQATENELEEER